MNQPESNIGLLVMHYGTPASMEEILPYYTHIRRGRAPSEEQLADLTSRYEAIGGPSPLTAISKAQAELIQAGLHKRGIPARLYVGTKHAPPFVSDAVKLMAEDGIDKAIAVVLAPHFSTFSIAAYKTYAWDARDQHRPAMEIAFLERWGTLPEFIKALKTRVEEALGDWSPQETFVIFSAHSLPEKIVASGDPYMDELLETSRLVTLGGGEKQIHLTFLAYTDVHDVVAGWRPCTNNRLVDQFLPVRFHWGQGMKPIARSRSFKLGTMRMTFSRFLRRLK